MPKQQGRVTRRGRIWFGYVYENGRRKQVNTHCTDRTAALIALRQFEQDAADPRKAAAARTTLRHILEMLVEARWSDAKAGKRAPETAHFYAKTSGTLLRLFGEDFEAEFSLSDRSDMKYPVLLGRSLLRQGRFVVDVARRNLSYKVQARAAARRARP